MRETAAHLRSKPMLAVEDEAFFEAYADRGLGDSYFDHPTRGEALNIATRALLKSGFNQWTWARCEQRWIPQWALDVWIVTVGAHRTDARVFVDRMDANRVEIEMAHVNG
jgi:hypothetical protein